ncbi:MAG TPA: efflux transporter outer membrane subunit [Burkholderiales bacterium]|nr:efflux transporter outer membrane subunit [Burkholderiales bacterium]
MRLHAILPVLMLAGCSVMPKFEPPAVEIPAQYKELGTEERGTWKEAEPADAVPRGEWWKVFRDPLLDQLELEAVASNQNLKGAAARVAQSRALLGVTAADRYPQGTIGFGATRERPSAVSQGLPDGTDTRAVTVWRAPLSASYEVDLFGRVASSVRAAENDLAATEALYRVVMLALQADVAQTYFNLRAIDAELGVLRETVRTREENVRLLQRRFDLGDIGELDLARSRTELSTTRTDAIGLERQRAQLEHALAVLLGRAPASFALAPAPLAANVPRVPAGLPSALLERRPDIAAAQRRMIATNARIGVARSAFFPSLTLTGTAGFESNELGNLFQWSSRTWLLGPLIGTMLSMPIFDGGRRRANVDRAWAALDESVSDYRQSVLVAFAEVEDNLAGLRVLSAQSEATRDSLTSASRALKLADTRYRAGATSYLDVIDAQRGLLSIRRLETQLAGARATATVALIRALGGGWDGPDVAAASATQ